ncbi:S-adenosyl-L-methionine-dependent methyltransferase [Glonium stellatum]|uniref:S-adenosyl-L-methionine-dependent methyltransferase n=1 Tax=Glonium stellatum TaxID=574774 RepID=A0A8E2FBX5_9PEZI|nr:S-adenosyl-L-methionine-dependent methyltransferase [Glonium stellatum]
MSLYFEAASVLTNAENVGGSLKSRIYDKKDLKSTPAQLFALVTEASKWSGVLKEVVERSGILKEERKLTPILALLLTHDLLLSKRGVAAPATHALKLAITRHKARLNAEFTKARLRQGFGTLQAFREHINSSSNGTEEAIGGRNGVQTRPVRHPRWIRINTLRTTLKVQLDTTFSEYLQANSLADVVSESGSAKIFYLDPHIPNLIALPPKADLSKSAAYTSGQLIFQDKASCFPACLIDPQPEDGDVIDACAAPGNKTTHLAAILCERRNHSAEADQKQCVFAYERDKRRAGTLEKMVKLAGADRVVKINGGRDFLTANPETEMLRVGALLLDPSCSGSGIVGRDDNVKIFLPDPKATDNTTASRSKSKKRKRQQTAPAAPPPELVPVEIEESPEDGASKDAAALKDRLEALSSFQLRILTHAMRFSAARKITYSTCSIHFEENEWVVFRALASPVAKERGWRIWKRSDQVEGMKKWERRGVWEEGKAEDEQSLREEERQEVLEGCIRCEKGTDEGTMGFFVAGFVRDSDVPAPTVKAIESAENDDVEEEEWSGFSEDENQEAEKKTKVNHGVAASVKISKKAKKKRNT